MFLIVSRDALPLTHRHSYLHCITQGEMYSSFGKPLWITEFAAMDFGSDYSATAAEAQAFQNAVIPFLESTNMVERYSWFGLFSNWK